MKVFGINALVLLVASQVGSVAAKDPSDSMQYYCYGEGLEFEQSVSIGHSRRVLINQGGFSQIESLESYPPMEDFIKQQLVHVGQVSSECADFLMSKSKKMSTDSSQVLARVHFAFDSSELNDSSKYLLENLIKRLNSNQRLLVEGHTDNVGTEAYNFDLGIKRSEEVVRYLENMGVDSNNMKSKSLGETMPVADNTTERGRYENRRVDIK